MLREEELTSGTTFYNGRYLIAQPISISSHEGKRYVVQDTFEPSLKLELAFLRYAKPLNDELLALNSEIADRLSRSDHPALCRLVTYELTPEHQYILSETPSGKPLHILRSKGVDLDLLLLILKPLCQALDAACVAGWPRVPLRITDIFYDSESTQVMVPLPRLPFLNGDTESPKSSRAYLDDVAKLCCHLFDVNVDAHGFERIGKLTRHQNDVLEAIFEHGDAIQIDSTTEFYQIFEDEEAEGYLPSSPAKAEPDDKPPEYFEADQEEFDLDVPKSEAPEPKPEPEPKPKPEPSKEVVEPKPETKNVRKKPRKKSANKPRSGSLDNFRIEKVLQKDVLGTLGLGCDLTRPNETILIRVISREASRRIAQHEFRSAITRLKGSQSSHITRFLKAGEDNGTWFFVLPNEHGYYLLDILSERGPLPKNEALWLLQEVYECHQTFWELAETPDAAFDFRNIQITFDQKQHDTVHGGLLHSFTKIADAIQVKLEPSHLLVNRQGYSKHSTLAAFAEFTYRLLSDPASLKEPSTLLRVAPLEDLTPEQNNLLESAIHRTRQTPESIPRFLELMR